MRRILRFLGGGLLRLLSRTTINGQGNLPRRGPFVIAGNHRAFMEVLLMLVACPAEIEFIGAGDIPLDPAIRFLAEWYGFIHYRRGSVDGKALRAARRVLQQGGVVGIFPEGGIWTAGPKEGQRGVAWLAAQTGAPVIPVGFGGIDDGVGRLLGFKMPRFEVNIGAVTTLRESETGRHAMDQFAARVMEAIYQLVPEWDQADHPVPESESYALRLVIIRPGTPDEVLERSDAEAAVLSTFYHIPIFLSIFSRNLRRRVSALESWETPQPAAEMAAALCRILGYLELRNRFLFTYRLGQERGKLLERGFRSLRNWLVHQGDALVKVIPIRTVKWPGKPETVLERPIG